MEELESKQLTLTIAGRPYPLKIKASDEPVIRTIVRDLNERINKFQLAYPTRDKQDCLALAILALAIDLHKITERTSSSQDFSEKISRINELLDSALH